MPDHPFDVSPPTDKPPSLAAGQTAATSRRVPKATYVPIKFDRALPDRGGALIKSSFVHQLGLQAGEVEAVGTATGLTRPQLDALRAFEGEPLLSVLPPPRAFAEIPTGSLLAFGKAVAALREGKIAQLAPSKESRHPRNLSGAPLALLRDQLHSAITAINGFEANIAVAPIGMLNLERIVMTPAGLQRGELIATIPLAPREKTSVVQKEWSVTSREFTSIVTDSLENYSETGVTENTELAQATTSQTAHTNQFNVNGSVTGTYGPVTATVASSFGSQDQNSESATESRKHAIDTTRKASSRVKQEHKVTISTTTVSGTSETSTRTLENPSTTDPIRIDYFSLIRKWHVGLYRYGLRLTYDLAIPEPAASMRGVYAQIALLQKQVGPFVFNLAHSDITAEVRPGESNPPEPHYLVLAERNNAQVPPPPGGAPNVIVTATAPNNDGAAIFTMPDLDIPDGYWIKNLFLQFHSESKTHVSDYQLQVLGSNLPGVQEPQGDHGADLPGGGDLAAAINGSFLFHASGKCQVAFRLADNRQTWIRLSAVIEPTDASKQGWVANVWNALYNAAQTNYFTSQQNLLAQIAALQDSLADVDTLTLRREENEEIMKGVLRWLLGPSFAFTPPDVLQMFKDQGADLAHGTSGNGEGLSATIANWKPMFRYQEMVKFINEAIEWENVLYFLYGYFWDLAPSWPFIRQLRHPDPTRQVFLRAGSARVVLTVRKGWEVAWVSFVETGGFGQTMIPGHPYLTIAQEIQAYDQTNYPGLPPANPAGGPVPDDGESVATESNDVLSASNSPVTLNVASSDGFHVGYTAVIDRWDSGVQEAQKILAVPSASEITVERLTNAHDGSATPLAVMQAGEIGQLMAEWFEYTPSSGTDIAVTSNLATVT